VGLYEEEVTFPNSYYDPETGNEAVVGQEDREHAEIAEAIECSDYLEALKESKGFTFLKEWLDGSIEGI